MPPPLILCRLIYFDLILRMTGIAMPVLPSSAATAIARIVPLTPVLGAVVAFITAVIWEAESAVPL